MTRKEAAYLLAQLGQPEAKRPIMVLETYCDANRLEIALNNHTGEWLILDLTGDCLATCV